jgi:dihydrodipicolinate synthase/N-acetylneuraminate lyase
MFELMKGGNYKLARDIHEQLTPFAIATHDPIMYHVVRIKIALHEMGQISSSSVRQPPFPGEEDRRIVRKSLEVAHLLPRKMLA